MYITVKYGGECDISNMVFAQKVSRQNVFGQTCFSQYVSGQNVSSKNSNQKCRKSITRAKGFSTKHDIVYCHKVSRQMIDYNIRYGPKRFQLITYGQGGAFDGVWNGRSSLSTLQSVLDMVLESTCIFWHCVYVLMASTFGV